MSLDRKIINRIEQNHLRILPRWFFAAKEILAWLLAGTLLGISALALAVATFLISIAERPLFGAPLAYLWLAVFGGFFMWGYRKLVQAGFNYVYKLSFMVIIPAVLLANIALGYAFYSGGQAAQVERKLEKIPVYQKLLPMESRSSENKSELPAQERGTTEKDVEAGKKSDPVPEAPVLRDEEIEQGQSNMEEVKLPKLKSSESRDPKEESGNAEEVIDDVATPAVKAKKVEDLSSSAKEMGMMGDDDMQKEAEDTEGGEQAAVTENDVEDAKSEIEKVSTDD